MSKGKNDLVISRSQVLVGEKSLHYRLYKYGQRHGIRIQSGYRENLCHYMRIILIRVPLIWFFKVPIIEDRSSKVSWVRPWMIAFVLAAFGSVAYAFYRWPDATWRILLETLRVLGTFVLSIGLLIGFVFLMTRKPIAQILRGCGRAVLDLSDLHVPRFARWFFKRGYLRVLYPWACTLIGVFAAIDLIFGHEVLLRILLEAAVWILSITVGFLVVVLLIAGYGGLRWLFAEDDYDLPGRVREWREERHERQTGQLTARPKKEHSTSLPRVIWSWVLAKKYRICPFIILPEEGLHTQNSSDWSG